VALLQTSLCVSPQNGSIPLSRRRKAKNRPESLLLAYLRPPKIAGNCCCIKGKWGLKKREMGYNMDKRCAGNSSSVAQGKKAKVGLFGQVGHVGRVGQKKLGDPSSLRFDATGSG